MISSSAATRVNRALMGMANRQLRITSFVAGRIWSVTSTMSGLHEYTVTYGIRQDAWDGTLHPIHEYPVWECNCPDFLKRGVPCKHIYAVKIANGKM